jgi:hypothetical protein
MPSEVHSALVVEPPPDGFDFQGVRTMMSEGKLPITVHKHVRAPFGHTVLSLRALESTVKAGDLALQAGEALHAALMEDVARSGSLAIPEPTRDQRLFIGAFSITVLCDALVPQLAALAPSPDLDSDLEAEGLEDLLAKPVREVMQRIFAMAGKYLEVQANRGGGGKKNTLHERESWVVTTLHAFFDQLHGAVERLTHLGRLRPFGIALSKRKVLIGDMRYEGFRARAKAEPVADLKPVKIEQIVGNQEYIEAGMRLARDVAAYDLESHRSPKQINPVLFGLGRPGCGKTITAHAIGNYFLEYCQERDVPARFKVIRRTDWASSYQNASANELVRIFKEEVYGFDGVCGVYWPDIDTAFASRGSGDLRMEEKQTLGAVFGIFDGTLIPKDGKWFMICDANFMQMDEATVSRIAQNPFKVKGPESPADYVKLMRDIMLRDVRKHVSPDDARWDEIGQRCVDHDLSGRNIEALSNNIRSHVQDFEYPADYFKASFEEREEIIAKLSRNVDVDEVLKRIEDYVEFSKDAEEQAEQDRFEREVDEMVRQLNAGRTAAERAAHAALGLQEGEAAPPDAPASEG